MPVCAVMDYEQIACILGLAVLACYGILVLALILRWPNESNFFRVLFCLSNVILGTQGTVRVSEDGEPCRWNGFATLLALTLGFESLYRCQIECKLMGRRMFRLYRPQPVHWQVLKSVVISVGMALAPINFYRHSPRLQNCFLRHSTGVAKLDETLVSFVWFLFFYLRPVIMTVKIFPEVLLKCRKHIVVLRHERELRIDDQLFLYKDHHRRLFIVISLLVSQINMILWLVLTAPYVAQVVSLVAGLGDYLQLEELSSWNATLFITMRLALPLLNGLVLLSSVILYHCLRLRSH